LIFSRRNRCKIFLFNQIKNK